MRREEKRKIIANKLKSFKDGNMGAEMSQIYQTMVEVEKEKQMLKDPNARVDLLNERAMIKQAIKRDPSMRTELTENDGATKQRRHSERHSNIVDVMAKPENSEIDPYLSTSNDSRHTEQPGLLRRSEGQKTLQTVKSPEKESKPILRSKTVRFQIDDDI